jgi:hypothetical protein
MNTKMKTSKKPQRTGLYEFEPTVMVDIKTAPPKKRAAIRKYYPMKVTYNSLEKETYLDIADQIINLDPEASRMTILTSEGTQEWDHDDDDV